MPASVLTAPRSRPRDSLRWIRWDLPLRVVPLAVLPFIIAALTPLSVSAFGLDAHLGPQLLLGLLLGPPMGWVSWQYRKRVVGWLVVPTDSDALLQTAYYVLLNAPAEELFFRGVLIGWLQLVVGPLTAWLLSTLVFGAYHIPAAWGYRAVAGVTLAGAFFGALYLLTGSLWAPIIVHAFATAGFLSAGPWLAHRHASGKGT